MHAVPSRCSSKYHVVATAAQDGHDACDDVCSAFSAFTRVDEQSHHLRAFATAYAQTSIVNKMQHRQTHKIYRVEQNILSVRLSKPCNDVASFFGAFSFRIRRTNAIPCACTLEFTRSRGCNWSFYFSSVRVSKEQNQNGRSRSPSPTEPMHPLFCQQF